MKQITQILCLGLMAIALANCNLAQLSAGSSTASEGSDETDTEASISSAIETLVDSSSSTSAASSSVSANLTTDTSYLSATLRNRHRFRCDDLTSVTESFSCDNTTGIMTRTVTFEDCELSNSHRDVSLNGSFSNEVENGGDGFCNADTTIDFAKMVMGRDDLDAIHEHATGDDDMVYSFINKNDEDVTVTRTSNRTVNYTDPVDDDDDGSAESVTASVEKNFTFVHTIAGEEKHNMTVFTTDEDFTSTDDEGTETTVEVSLPNHTITYDENGYFTGRTINSGNLIADHNMGKIRLVFGVGADGLTFDNESCGPVDGTMTLIGYTINDDGTIGGVMGTGEVVFEDGEVQTANFDGVTLNPRPRPCH